METNYIAHHGVKGQKWGVRKQQQPLGTKGKKSNSSKESFNKKKMSGKKKAALIIGGSVLAAAAITAGIVIAKKNKGAIAAKRILRDQMSAAKFISNTKETTERWSKDYFADGRFIERLADGTVREGRWK